MLKVVFFFCFFFFSIIPFVIIRSLVDSFVLFVNVLNESEMGAWIEYSVKSPT